MLGYVNYNGVPIAQETQLGKYLMTLERPANYRPENHPYPKMLYKAVKGSDGIAICLEDAPNPFHYGVNGAIDMGRLQQAENRVRTINESRMMTVHTEEEHKARRAEGWRDTPKEAEAQVTAWEHDMQEAAAVRAYEDRNMSEAAKREIAVAEASTDQQLVSVPESRTIKKPHHMSKEARAARAAAKA